MRGLPDFGAPLSAHCFAGYDQPGSVLALPDTLGLASDAAGVPRLTLERFRGRDAADERQRYGLVSARFVLGWPELAGERPVSCRIIPDAGVLTVQLDQVNGDPTVIGAPIAWDGSLSASWGARVTPELMTWMIEALGMRLLPLHARATLSVRGIAPRLPVRLEVHADRLAALTGGNPADALAALIDDIGTPGAALTVHGEGGSAEHIARIVIDRLNSDLPQPTGMQSWNLAQPFVTRRSIAIHHRLRDQLATAGIDPAVMIPPGTQLPALQLGWHTLDVLANLPDRRSGVIGCGVNLLAPPRLPARHQASIAGCEFTTAQSRQQVTLRLSPDEPLAYVSEPWMIVDGPSGIREVHGARRQCTAQRLIVNADEFGIAFARVQADAALLELATVEVQLLHDRWAGEIVTLDRDHPEAALALDDAVPAHGASHLHIRLRSITGDHVITLPECLAGDLALGLAAVPGWGAHAVRVINTSPKALAIELSDEAGTASDVLHIAPGQTRSWHWVATDPFRPGYRYRDRPVGEPGPWQGPHTEAELRIGAGA